MFTVQPRPATDAGRTTLPRRAMTTSYIEAGCFERMAYVRVHGLGSVRVAEPLNDFLRKRLTDGYARFVVDLDPCDGMDSTFMGVLAGSALALARTEGGGVSVVNFNERCYRQMEELGLTKVLDVRTDPLRCPQIPVKVIAREDAPPAPFPLPTVKDSHENLVKANPKNAEKFGPFLKDLPS